MRIKIVILSLFIASSVLIFSACSKKKDTTATPAVLKASFTYSGNRVNLPATITFTSTSTKATAYSWDFGDGQLSSDANPTHTYNTIGAYIVVLYVTDGTNNDQSSQTLVIGSNGSAYLCSGKSGVNTYLPLATGNVWTYGFNYNNGGNHDTYTVLGTQTIGSNTYYHVLCYFGLTSGTNDRYFRVDGSNNVYESVNGTENLYLPGNPTAGQDLGFTNDFEGSSSFDRKVVSTNATVTTDGCTYTNCLEIQELNVPFGTSIDYYVKGLGCVSSVDYQLAGAVLN